MKTKLNKIRKPKKKPTGGVMLRNALLILLLGVLLGVFAKWLDELELDDRIWWHLVIEKLDLGNYRDWYYNNQCWLNGNSNSLWRNSWYCIRKCNMGIENINNSINSVNDMTHKNTESIQALSHIVGMFKV